MSSASDSNAIALQDFDPKQADRASKTPEGRTLFSRTGRDGPIDQEATARARRSHLLAHASRASARREAFIALVRSHALAELVEIDSDLHHDMAKLLAFVMEGSKAAKQGSR